MFSAAHDAQFNAKQNYRGYCAQRVRHSPGFVAFVKRQVQAGGHEPTSGLLAAACGECPSRNVNFGLALLAVCAQTALLSFGRASSCLSGSVHYKSTRNALVNFFFHNQQVT